MNPYDIAGYGAMIADGHRFGAYRSALQQSVQRGAKVLDLGAGTGIFALLACRFGAAHVYAIEAADVIEVARAIARANGLDGRISFFHDPSKRVTLPERVDVLVSDLRGALPLFGDHIPSIIDARRRFLRSGATMIPHSDTLWVAPVEHDEFYRGLVSPWETTGTDLDMSAARAMVTQSLHRKRVDACHLLAAGQRWAALDYESIESPHAQGSVEFSVERGGDLHGFILWFDSRLVDGIHLSNAPGRSELIYGSTFLPLPEAVHVRVSARVALELQAKRVGEDYVWRWDTMIASNGNDPARRFSQSTFYGIPLARRTLRRASADETPALSPEGRIDREALGLLDGRMSLAEIARHLRKQHPEAFDDARDALDRIVALALRYAE